LKVPFKLRTNAFLVFRKIFNQEPWGIDMEKLRDVTEEQKNFAVDAMVTLVIEELVNDLKLSSTTLLKDFIASKTGVLLYDESSKIWWNGPSYIAELYKKEMGGNGRSDTP